MLRLAGAEADLELAERPGCAAEHRLLTVLLPIRQRLLRLPDLRLRPRQYPVQPVPQRSWCNDRLHRLAQLVEPAGDGREGGAGRASRGAPAELVCADIAGGDPIPVAILRTGQAALVRGGRGADRSPRAHPRARAAKAPAPRGR